MRSRFVCFLAWEPTDFLSSIELKSHLVWLQINIPIELCPRMLQPCWQTDRKKHLGQGAGAVHEPPVAHSWNKTRVTGEHHLLLLEPDESPWGDMRPAAETELWPFPVVTNASDIAHFISWAEVCHPIQKTSSCASWMRPWHMLPYTLMSAWKYSKFYICF